MPKPRNPKTMSDALDLLFYDLCVKWGFCIPLAEERKIKHSRYLTAEYFARKILLAEDMNPEYEKKWLRKIKQLFVERFGEEWRRVMNLLIKKNNIKK